MSDAIVDDERSVKYNEDSRADRIWFNDGTVSLIILYQRMGADNHKNHSGQP